MTINAAAGWQLESRRPFGVAGAGVLMAGCWVVALRQVSGSHMARGVATFSISGLLLLLPMGMFVPEFARLFGFSTFIFLAFGLSYMSGRASIATVALTISVASTLLAVSSALHWSSGLPEDLLRWVDLSGMVLTLSVDAMLFIMLRDTLESRGQRLLQAEIAMATERTEREVAEKSEHVKSELLSNMSHEIRTPMNAVIAMNDMMLKTTNLDQAQRDMAETIRMSSEHLLVIINDILDLSRFESGRTVLEHRDFDPVQSIEHALELIAPQAVTKGLFIGYVTSPSVPRTITGDPARVTQILVNFLSNAVKFTERGSVMASVECIQRLPPSEERGGDGTSERCMLQFSIEDTGPGIAQNDLDRLFRPFSQLDASTARRFGGTGLGLAICRKLSELMGGDVDVRSTEGKGSTFSFRAPFERQLSSSLRTVPDDAHLLLVTDREAVRRSFESHAARLDFELTTIDGTEPVGSHVARTRATQVIVDATTADDEAAARRAVEGLLAGWTGGAPRGLALLRHDSSTITSETTSFGGAIHLMGIPVREQSLIRFLTGTVEEAASATTSAATEVTEPPPNDTIIAELRVLLAEDNIVNQKVTGLLLQKLGVAAEIANNGAEALAKSQQTDFDLILMDVQMPEMDGLEATREIRKHRSNGRPRIVALTASVLPDQVDACLSAGMDYVVSKPVTLDQLHDVLQEASTSGAGTIREQPTERTDGQ